MKTVYRITKKHVTQYHTSDNEKKIDVAGSIAVKDMRDGFDKVVKHIEEGEKTNV